MSADIPVRSPMRGDAFVAEVKRRAAVSHLVIRTDHAATKMAERAITMRQVISALRKGSLGRGPKWNEEHGNWEGRMEYHGTGVRVTVVCAIAERTETVIVVTAY